MLEIGLWAREYQEIDVFNWQQEVADMVSLPEIERELAVAEGRVRGAVERGQVKPDHALQLGERTYFYFHRERVEEVRLAVGAPKTEDHTARDRFLQFIALCGVTAYVAARRFLRGDCCTSKLLNAT